MITSTLSPTRKSWRAMRNRCYVHSNSSYASYGGRGIRVCDRWLGPDGFANFLSDMGQRQPGMTLDRKDGEKDYAPDNCQWATRATQTRNRSAVKLTADVVRDIVVGKLRNVSSPDIGRMLGINRNAARLIRRGERWSDVVADCRKEAA